MCGTEIEALMLHFLSTIHITMKKLFKVNSVEVITGQKNDLLKINFTTSQGTPGMIVYKFKDNLRHKRSFNSWLKHNSTDFLMYNIKNKWNSKFVRLKAWYRSDGKLMVEDTVVM